MSQILASVTKRIASATKVAAPSKTIKTASTKPVKAAKPQDSKAKAK
jgi:hypothetical protein